VTPGYVGTSKLTLTVRSGVDWLRSRSTRGDATAAVHADVPGQETSERPLIRRRRAKPPQRIDVARGLMIRGRRPRAHVAAPVPQRTRGSGESTSTSQPAPQPKRPKSPSRPRNGRQHGCMDGLQSNKHNGEMPPNRDTVFAATITGSGASTELTYLGSYTELREDLINWGDNANGSPIGLPNSRIRLALRTQLPHGFNVEGPRVRGGVEHPKVSTRSAPRRASRGRTPPRLLSAGTNFSSTFNGSAKRPYGTPNAWNRRRAIREIRRNSRRRILVF